MNEVIYEERLFSRWITLILGGVALFIVWNAVEQFQTGSSDGAPFWLMPSMAVLFVVLTINFAWLTIRITTEEVVVSYGLFRHRVRWHDIEDCYADEASATWYGGYGIRIGWYAGKRRLIYNTIGNPRVVLLTGSASTPEFVFSTAQPDEVIRVVRGCLRMERR
jgi:hypothetical protein